jgi:CRP/FNR family transcriptional regulator
MMHVADRDVAEAMAGSFLGKLPPEVIDQLISDGERSEYPAGTTLYRRGSAPPSSLVVRGLIRAYMASPDGRQVTVRYAKESDVLNVLGITGLVGGPAHVSIQTLVESTLFTINSRTLTAAARRDASVAWTVAEELNRRLSATLHQTAVNAFGSVKQRVAAHLLDLAAAQQRPLGRLVAHVSQQELADAVGSVREVVARTLRELRAAGMVATAADGIAILDADRLRHERWSDAGDFDH